MRALLIDVDRERIEEVEVSKENFLDDAYRLIKCETIEVAFNFPPHPQANGTFDTIFVDENGLVTDGPKKFWIIQGGHQPFAGNGLVVAVDDEGNTVGAMIAIERLQSMVEFMARR
jgi:hypothetical protein